MIFTLKHIEQLPENIVLKLYDIFYSINIKHYLTELYNDKDDSKYVNSISNAIFKYCSNIDSDIYFELKNFNETTIIPGRIKKYNNQFFILPYDSCVKNIEEYQNTLKRTLNSL